MTRIISDILKTTIERRGFIAGAGGLTFAFTLAGGLAGRIGEALAANEAKLNAWVTIGTDDAIYIMVPGAEMGQGVMTALPKILAEDLDADWSRVKPVWAPPNPKLYGNPHPLFNGAQVTAASVSVAGFYEPLRIAGAQARRVLMEAAAKHWGVPVEQVSTEPSTVVHGTSGRKLTYGQIAAFAMVPDIPPKIGKEDLKKPSRFRLIGKDVPRLDVPSKVNGTAQYGIDVMRPGMVYATLMQSPMEGAKPDKVNVPQVMRVKGVTKVIPLPFGVAVVGESVEATRAGREVLDVTWNTENAVAAGFDSDIAKAEYAEHAEKPHNEPKTWFVEGDAKNPLKGASTVIERTYSSEYAYHAQMEPMTAVADTAPDGKSAEIWIGTQSNFLVALVTSQVLGTTPDKITVHQQMLGGGFGRRIWPDAAVQATVISKIVQKPVKLIATREDDVAAARPRPMTHHLLRAGLDTGGGITGWHHRLVAENVDAIAAPPRFKATGGKDVIGWRGLEQPFYDIPNRLADAVREIRGMRVHAWRAIGAGYNKFASEVFLDEIAAETGVDPVQLRLQLTKNHPRAHNIVKVVADMADWDRKRPEGRGLGIAFSDYHGTFVAGAAEISVDRDTGRIKVHEYWTAVDPGIVIDPRHVVAQMESGVVYGISGALKERLTVSKGAIEQSNFHDYEVARMSDVPEIHVRISATDDPPTGLGEVGVPPVAPAIANAFAALTGKWLRYLPMSPERVKEALKA